MTTAIIGFILKGYFTGISIVIPVRCTGFLQNIDANRILFIHSQNGGGNRSLLNFQAVVQEEGERIPAEVIEAAFVGIPADD